MLRSALIGALLGVMLYGGAAEAAPSNPQVPTCRPDVVTQYDMTGVYESTQMMYEIHPCGGSTLWWLNQYGEHVNVYLTVYRVPSGGYLADGYMPDPEGGFYIDNSVSILVKPAERGWIQIGTISEAGQLIRTYRLRKTS